MLRRNLHANGRTADDKIVAEKGACITALRNLFETALEATLAYYREYSTSFGSYNTPEIVFSTDYARRNDAECIGGVTIGDPTMRRVQLVIHINKFDWKSYLASLYILFHECICHVFQNLLGAPVPEPKDIFAEGWMDWVSLNILLNVLAKKSIAANLCSRLAHPPQFEGQAVSVHLEKNDAEQYPPHDPAAYRKMG